MKFLDLYSQDKPILNIINKDINKIIINSDFILGKKQENSSKSLQDIVIQNLQSGVETVPMHFIWQLKH